MTPDEVTPPVGVIGRIKVRGGYRRTPPPSLAKYATVMSMSMTFRLSFLQPLITLYALFVCQLWENGKIKFPNLGATRGSRAL